MDMKIGNILSETKNEAPLKEYSEKTEGLYSQSQSRLENEKIAVLIPCYNEELTVAKVINDFRLVLPQAAIYVFDNNSTDRTAEIARKNNAIVIRSPQQGKGYVVRHMFTVVDASIYIMVDGDDTYPAEIVLDMLKKFKETGAHMCVGVRLKDFEDTSFRPFHQMGNHLVTKLITTFFKIQLSDVLSGYRIFNRDFIKSIPLISSGFEIETELTLQAISKQFHVIEYPISYRSRPAGSFSKLNTWKDGILVLRSIFLLLKNYRPLIFYSSFAFLLGLSSLYFGSFPVLEYFQTGMIKRFPLAILASGVAVMALVFFAIGLILDTILRYHQETFQQLRKLKKN